MIAFATFQRMTEACQLPVGVFEDDVLLLRLAAMGRFADHGCLRASGLMNSDDLAFEVARLTEVDAWES